MSSKKKYDYKKETQNQEFPIVEEIEAPSIINYVVLESLIQSRLEYTGKVSGRQYVWNGGGDTVSVLEEDAPELLAKHLGKTCCGNDNNRIFQIVQ